MRAFWRCPRCRKQREYCVDERIWAGVNGGASPPFCVQCAPESAENKPEVLASLDATRSVWRLGSVVMLVSRFSIIDGVWSPARVVTEFAVDVDAWLNGAWVTVLSKYRGTGSTRRDEELARKECVEEALFLSWEILSNQDARGASEVDEHPVFGSGALELNREAIALALESSKTTEPYSRMSHAWLALHYLAKMAGLTARELRDLAGWDEVQR